MHALPVMVVLALIAEQLGGCAARSRGQSAPSIEAVAPVAAVTEAAPAPVMEVAADVIENPRAKSLRGILPTGRLARDDVGYAAMTSRSTWTMRQARGADNRQGNRA